jgi:hypothetical protein
MTWETFWFPNIVQSTLFAAISAIVVFAVGLILRWWWKHWGQDWVRTWAADLLTEKLKPTEDAALDAASSARGAKDAADAGAGDAKVAASNASDAGAKLEIVGARLVDVLGENRGMATRLDDLLSAYLRLRAIAREQGVHLPPDLDPDDLGDDLELEETQAIMVTGRHLLHPPGDA